MSVFIFNEEREFMEIEEDKIDFKDYFVVMRQNSSHRKQVDNERN